MSRPRLLACAVLLAACGPRPATTTGGDAVAASEVAVADTESELTIEPPVVAEPAGLTDLEPLELVAEAVTPKLELLRRGAWGAAVAANSDAVVLFGVGRGWLLEGGKLRYRARGDWYAAAFAPDGAHAAIVTGGHLLVVDVHRGKVVHRYPVDGGSRGSPETVAARFLDDDEIAFFDGCQLSRMPVGKGEAVAIGPSTCGRPHPSADGTRWLVWSQNDDGEVAVHHFDVASDEVTTVLGGRGDAPGLSVFAAAADAGAFCFSRHADRSKLSCRELSTGTELVVWDGTTDGRAAFGPGGRVVFGGGPLKSERPLVVVDVAARTRQVVGELSGGEEWLAFLGAERVIASGGSRALVFDLATRRRLEVDLGDGKGEGEWEGLVVPPAATTRFLLGKERRASRDLYWVALP